MNKKIPHIITLAVTTGLLAIAGNTAHAQTADLVDQSEFPTITAQPVDQAVTVGSNAVLSVQAVNADNYQWQTNGVDIEGQTNSTLTIQNVGVNDAGSYSCNVSQSGGDAVPTRAASLDVWCLPAWRRLTAFSAEDRLLCSACPRLVVAHKEPVRANTLAISITPRQFHKAGVGCLPPTPQSLRLLMAAGGQIQKLHIWESVMIVDVIKPASPFPTRHTAPVTDSQSIFRKMCRQPTIPSS